MPKFLEHVKGLVDISVLDYIERNFSNLTISFWLYGRPAPKCLCGGMVGKIFKGNVSYRSCGGVSREGNVGERVSLRHKSGDLRQHLYLFKSEKVGGKSERVERSLDTNDVYLQP